MKIKKYQLLMKEVQMACEYQVSEYNIVKKASANPSEITKIATSTDSAQFIRKLMGDTVGVREVVHVITLNRALHIKGVHLHSIGNSFSSIVDMKMISFIAVHQLADAVILVHNHPSGNLIPSDADIVFTKKAKEALNLFEIKMIDSVILTEQSHYSFSDEGML